MAQLTLYVDEKMLKQIELEAKKEKSSVSKWVAQKLSLVLRRSWPARFLDTAGALKGEGLKRPPQNDFAPDVRRAKL